MLTEVALARVDLGQLSPTRHLLRKQEKPIRKPQPNRLGQSSVRETSMPVCLDKRTLHPEMGRA